MDTENAKKMMDAFYEAKRIRDQLPPLPDGVNASYINILDTLTKLSESGHSVRISDVADFRGLPRPVVTRTVKEMEEKGLVTKIPDAKDRRVVHLAATSQGKRLYHTYVSEYFDKLSVRLEDISDAETEEMIRTIHKIGKALGQGYQ